MEKEIAISNIKHISSQRNLFLLLTLALSITSASLAMKLLKTDQRTILIPGLSQEVWVENGGVSKSYLEESTNMYLPMLLNLNKDVINYNAGKVFKYISQSDPRYLNKLQEYFVDVKDKYTKFNLSTHFTTKNMEIDSKKLTVLIHGTLTVIYGENGFELIPKSYKLTFEWISGSLRIKEFLRVLSKDEKGSEDTSILTDFIKSVEKEKVQ